MVRREGQTFAVVGACPRPATIYSDGGILREGITEQSARAFGEKVAAEGVFGSNSRSGADYRRKIAAVLVRRAALALKEQEG